MTRFFSAEILNNFHESHHVVSFDGPNWLFLTRLGFHSAEILNNFHETHHIVRIDGPDF
jgi:hypothetical protein